MKALSINESKLTLATMPLEVTVLIFRHLSPSSLVNLSLTSKLFHSLVQEWGWQSCLRYNHNSSRNLLSRGSLRLSPWIDNPRLVLRYIHLTEQGWSNRVFVARPLTNPWPGKQHPILALNTEESFLAIAAGPRVISYRFCSDSRTDPTTLRAVGDMSFRPPTHQIHEQHPIDITGFALSSSSPHAFVGLDSGHLRQINLPTSQSSRPYVIRNFEHPPELIRSLSSQNNLLLSYSTGGLISLYSIDNENPGPISTLRKPVTRGWSTYYNSSSSIIAVGSSSPSPLLVYSIDPTGVSRVPIANLGRGMKPQQRRFAVYGITGPPSSFPGGQSDQIIISSWFDGKVRIHDLRDAARGYNNYPNFSGGLAESDAPIPLSPCQVLYDPWTTGDAKYSVSAGGPGGACIASGSAVNSIICLWDVRQPINGWSVHAPGNDRSPIYSLKFEYSRIWTANQSRACVVDFGPDVSLRTYPTLPRTARSLPPKPGTGGLSYLATYYSHRHESTGPAQGCRK